MQLFKNIYDSSRKNLKYFLLVYIFSIIIYSVLITNELTNTYDGLWHGSFGLAWNWEASIGRFLWVPLDISHLGCAAEPMNILSALFLFSMGISMIPTFFHVNDGLLRYLVSALLMCNTTILVFLSYRYMVLTFASSFFLSILAVYFLLKEDKKLSIIGSTVLFLCTFSIYQANVTCSIVLIIFLMIHGLISGKKYKDIGIFFLKGIISFVLSGILYKLIWSFVIRFFNLATSNYNGADTVSLGSIILALPVRILNSYQASYMYFFTQKIYFNVYQRVVLFFHVLLIIFFICYLIKIISILRGNSIRNLFALVLTAIIPVAANISLLLAPDSGFLIQMTMGMAMILPLCFLIMRKPYEVLLDNEDNETETNKNKSNTNLTEKIYICITGLSFIILLYGNLLMVSMDQHTMLQGKTTTMNLMNRIVSDVEDIDDIEEKTVYFAGKPASNPLFSKDKNWQYSNSYAKYGDIWLYDACLPMSYTGMLRDLGSNLKLEGDANTYHTVIESDQVKKMPVYPAEGSIHDFNGKVVIKVSDDY